ncbi:hypothetical protein JCM11251_000955 [Rhodosporidiobolus azoricus]
MPPAGPPPLPVLSFGTAHPLDDSALPSFPTAVISADPSSDAPGPSSQSSAATSSSANLLDLQYVARAVLKAKRVAVVCGAGISTATGIPDFRSGAGLFKSLKEQYPDAKLSSGKDLFDVGLFSSESNAAIFYNMIAALKKQADDVEPTAFHSWLKELDDEGKLFRVYTQNIDALEEKAGLTYGLGDKSLPLPPRRAARSPTKPRASTSLSATPGANTPSSTPLMPSSSQISSDSSSSYPTPRPSLSPPPPPPTHSEIPRVIPLHGHLSTLSCSACKFTTPTTECMASLENGSAPVCPSCLEIEEARTTAGGRSRGVGMLRPDVVLYGEEHKDGERVGEITRRDLMGQRPDLLIVVGTTLKVKGTKRLVRELAKVIKPPVKETEVDQSEPSSSASTRSRASAATASQQSLATKKRGREKPPPIHTVYLNYDFPTPSRDWAGLFDIWLRGDIQQFVAAVKEEKEKVKEEEGERERKRQKRRESSGAAAASSGGLGGVKNAAFGAGLKAQSAGTMGLPPSPASTNRFHVDVPPRRAPLDRSIPPHLRPPQQGQQPAPLLPFALPGLPSQPFMSVPAPVVAASAFLAPVASTGAACPSGPIMPFSRSNLPPLPALVEQTPTVLPATVPKKRSRSPSPRSAAASAPVIRRGKGWVIVEEPAVEEDESGYVSGSSLTKFDEDENKGDGENEDEEPAAACLPPAPSSRLPSGPRRRSATLSSSSSSGTVIISESPPLSASTSTIRRRSSVAPSNASNSPSTATITKSAPSRRSSPRDNVVQATVDSVARSQGRRMSLTTILNQEQPATSGGRVKRGRSSTPRGVAKAQSVQTQTLPFKVTKRNVADVTGTKGAKKGEGAGRKSRSASEEGSEASVSSYGRARKLRRESLKGTC